MSDFYVDPNPESSFSPRGGELIVSAGQGIPTPALFAESPPSTRNFGDSVRRCPLGAKNV